MERCLLWRAIGRASGGSLPGGAQRLWSGGDQRMAVARRGPGPIGSVAIIDRMRASRGNPRQECDKAPSDLVIGELERQCQRKIHEGLTGAG